MYDNTKLIVMIKEETRSASTQRARVFFREQEDVTEESINSFLFRSCRVTLTELKPKGMGVWAANTIAWAMEANKKGLWDNGLEFGSVEELSAIFEDIAHRRGIGDKLAEGSKRLSEKYGGKEFAMHSKGLELAAYEPRRAVVGALATPFPTGAAGRLRHSP